MSDGLELLSSDSHRHMRMRQALGAFPHFVPVVIQEFGSASNSCPIFFAKDPGSGEFYAAALFGFQPGESLVEGAEKGTSAFQPLELQRQGFFAAGENIAIDIGHPRFGSGATLALFEDDDTPTNSLRQIQRVIGELASGQEATRRFIREMLVHKLIEPIDISLSFDDGERLSLDGLYTISRDALSALDDSAIIDLYRKGYLQAIFCLSNSLGQVAVLARRRNARLTSGS